MSSGDWMDRVLIEIDDFYSGNFLAKFDDKDRAKESWKRAIVRKLPLDDKQRAAAVLRKAVDMVPHECPYPPVLADLIGLIDHALADSRREASMERRYPAIAKTSDNPLLSVINHVEARAEKSAVAVEELGKIQRILSGEPVEPATGMTIAQHKERLDEYGRRVMMETLRDIHHRQRIYGDANNS